MRNKAPSRTAPGPAPASLGPLLLLHVPPDLALQLVDAGDCHEGVDRQKVVVHLGGDSGGGGRVCQGGRQRRSRDGCASARPTRGSREVNGASVHTTAGQERRRRPSGVRRMRTGVIWVLKRDQMRPVAVMAHCCGYDTNSAGRCMSARHGRVALRWAAGTRPSAAPMHANQRPPKQRPTVHAPAMFAMLMAHLKVGAQKWMAERKGRRRQSAPGGEKGRGTRRAALVLTFGPCGMVPQCAKLLSHAGSLRHGHWFGLRVEPPPGRLLPPPPPRTRLPPDSVAGRGVGEALHPCSTPEEGGRRATRGWQTPECAMRDRGLAAPLPSHARTPRARETSPARAGALQESLGRGDQT